MDKALDYGSRDSRFESWWGQSFLKLLAPLNPFPLNKHNVHETKYVTVEVRKGVVPRVVP